MRHPALVRLLCAHLWCVLACGEPRFSPEPRVLEPASAEAGTSVEVVIRGRHFLPHVEANYSDRERSRVDGAFGVRLGEVDLEDVTFVSTTELRGRVPAGLPPGRYALVVVGPGGAEGHLADAFQVLARPAVSLALTTPARTVAAGACSEPVELEVHDVDGLPGRLEAPLDVALALSPAGAVSLFADPACGQAIGSVRLEPSAPRQAVYFSGTVPVRATLSGTSSLGAVEQRVRVVPGPVARFAWSAVPSRQQVGVAFDVRAEALDAFGNPTDPPLGAELTTVPAAPLRCLAGCHPSGWARFHEGVFSGAVVVDVPARELRLALTSGSASSASEAFEVLLPPPTALAFASSSHTVAQGACSAPVVLELRGAGDAVLPAHRPTPVQLSTEPSGALLFFTDAACETPLTQPSFGTGESRLTFHFSGQLPGAADLTATSADLASAEQRHQVSQGSAASFAFDAIPTPQRRGVDIPVRVRALDGTGALATSFTGSARLSLAPAGVPLLCSGNCASDTVTQAFENGVWTGTVRVGGPAGSGRVLSVTSGSMTGGSAAFSIVDVIGTPPRARLVRQPAVVRVGQPVTLDASGSSDLESAVGLEVSFDPEGRASAPPPWSPWSPIATTATATFSAPGLHRSRIAVRDPDGNVGYATADVLVLDESTPLCVVTDGSGTDHGTSRCDDPDLSLVEALRIANATPGRQVITFRQGLAVAFTQTLPLSVSGDVDIIAPPGVTVTGPRWSFDSGTVLLSSLLLQGGGSGGPLGDVHGGSVRFSDVTVRNSGSLELEGGQATFEGSRFEACASACVVIDEGAGDVRVSHSSFQGVSQNGLNVHDCRSGVREIASSTFRDLNKGLHVKNNCGSGPVVAVNNTFSQVGSAAAFDAGGGHAFVNNIIVGASSGPLQGCNASFARRSHNLIWSSTSDGCTATDPGVLLADPMFISNSSGDYRLRAMSPARDSALDSGAEVTPGSPGNFLGLAPDRGGRETW